MKVLTRALKRMTDDPPQQTCADPDLLIRAIRDCPRRLDGKLYFEDIATWIRARTRSTAPAK